MAAVVRFDPLVFLNSDDAASQASEQQPSPPYTKPAPPYSPATSNAPVATPNTPLEPPPDYNPFNPFAHDFQFRAPFIYASSYGSDIPHYQINVTRTRAGRPHQLRMRRLMANESRRLSLITTTSSTSTAAPSTSSSLQLQRSISASSSVSSTSSPSLAYDDDATMYTATLFLTSGIEIRGHRASTLAGYLKVDRSPGGGWKVWHMTRNVAGDALDPANEARMLKYGYQADREWNRVLLFVVKGALFGRGKSKGTMWKNGNGEVVAVEKNDKLRLEIEIGRQKRDVLIMCWMARKWVHGSLGWDI